jgi:hypothetical protein
MGEVELMGCYSWPKGPAYLGTNLLVADFSGGLEPIEVPCTNDVDREPPPYLEYITKSRLIFFTCVFPGRFTFSAIFKVVIVVLSF